jgi:DNA-binding NarL/FixJ family response regulator
MTPPRILLVDDQRQVSRVLRSALEVSSRDYIINDVSSAEEALLEISRGPLDLLVTDLRLPGMTGLELVENLLKSNPKAKSILITGDPTEDVRRRAEALGVIAFLRKPIGTNMFLEIVEHALAGLLGEADSKAHQKLSKETSSRLMDLRQELGAEAVMLFDAEGTLVAKAGEDQDLDYVLLIVFRGRQEAGQMGAVVHFGRRSAEDLLDMLDETSDEAPSNAEILVEEAGTEEAMAKKDIKPEDLEQAAKDVDSSGAESFWEQAVSESPGRTEAEGDALTYEEARKMGLVDDEEGD